MRKQNHTPFPKAPCLVNHKQIKIKVRSPEITGCAFDKVFLYSRKNHRWAFTRDFIIGEEADFVDMLLKKGYEIVEDERQSHNNAHASEFGDAPNFQQCASGQVQLFY